MTAVIQILAICCQISYSSYFIHFNGISHSVESPNIFLVICANGLIHLITKRHVAFPSSPVLNISIKILPIVISPVKDFESLKYERAFSKFIPKSWGRSSKAIQPRFPIIIPLIHLAICPLVCVLSVRPILKKNWEQVKYNIET